MEPPAVQRSHPRSSRGCGLAAPPPRGHPRRANSDRWTDRRPDIWPLEPVCRAAEWGAPHRPGDGAPGQGCACLPHPSEERQLQPLPAPGCLVTSGRPPHRPRPRQVWGRTTSRPETRRCDCSQASRRDATPLLVTLAWPEGLWGAPAGRGASRPAGALASGPQGSESSRWAQSNLRPHTAADHPSHATTRDATRPDGKWPCLSGPLAQTPPRPCPLGPCQDTSPPPPTVRPYCSPRGSSGGPQPGVPDAPGS